MNKSKYYPYVDGLRGIAVILVLIYHLNPEIFKGGFLGVDIFFVISGYLITGIIKRKVASHSFNFLEFYYRRIKRLLPCLLTTLLLVLVIGLFILTPAELTEFSKTSVYSLLSVSNIYFYLNSGYFDVASESQLLLHTWSLAVEAQFYLIWPFFIVFICQKISPKHQPLAILLTILLGSTVTWLVSINDPSMAFYLTPFRISEFAIGAFLCWLKFEPKQSAQFSNLSVLASFALFTLILVLISAEGISYHFPGWIVLIPCLLTAVIIYFGKKSKICTRLLANQPLVFLGKISYAFYLYHWPLIVLFKKKISPDIDLVSGVAIAVITLILAIVTTYVIESPIRKRQFFVENNFINGSLLFTLILIFPAVLVFSHAWSSQGYPQRFPSNIAEISLEIQNEKDYRFHLQKQNCVDRGWNACEVIPSDAEQPVVLILGDSHGIDGLNILQPHFPDFYYILQSVPGCPPMLSNDFRQMADLGHPNYDKCLQLLDNLAMASNYENVDYLVISSYYLHFQPETLINFLNLLPEKLLEKTLFFGNAPGFKYDLPDTVIRKRSTSFSEEEFEEIFEYKLVVQDQAIRKVASEHGLAYVSKLDFYCPEKQCNLVYGDSEKLLTYDQHHLSFAAANELGKSLKLTYGTFDNLLSATKAPL